MARCEDFPCCGHESGCCPDFDENGKQLNMRCTCGAKLPINNRSSICSSCIRNAAIEDGDFDGEHYYATQDEQEDLDDFQDDDRDYEREDSPDDDGDALGGNE